MASKFTQRHYQEIARLFRATLPAKSGSAESQWYFMRDRFITFFEEDNYNFKKEKFVEACISPSGPYSKPAVPSE